MATYKQRLTRDVDAWIGAGLVPSASRQAILEGVAEDRRFDSATVLAVIGGVLAATAVVALVAANWGAIPRLGRFGLVLGAFLATGLGSAWAVGGNRPVLRHTLLLVAAIIFAAAIGLTGQIFDIVGTPRTALHAAGLSAGMLALAGASPWPAAAALLFIGFGDFGLGGSLSRAPGWLVLAAPMSIPLALHWRSAALAQATAIALLVAGVDGFPDLFSGQRFLVGALTFAVIAVIARGLRPRYEAPAAILYGWLTWGALLYFGLSGLDAKSLGVAHAIAWLSLSAAVVVLGRRDHHGGVIAAGVVGLFAAGASLLWNLGLSLLTSALVFGACAVLALGVALVLRRAKPAR